MGIFKDLFKTKNQAEPNINFTSWDLPVQTSSGEMVTTENSLKVAAVFSAIQIRANTLAKLPLQVFQETKDGKVRAKMHPIARLLETRPNPYQTPFNFKFSLETHRCSHGIAYIRQKVNKLGRVEAIYLLNPPSVSVVEDKDGKMFYIENLGDGKTNVYSEEEIIRIPFFTTNGFDYKSPLQILRETIGVLKQQNKFLASYYANGTLSRGVLKVNAALNKDAKDAVRAAWLAANSGESNASKIAVLDNGIEFQNITIPLQEAEFIATQNFGIAEIARAFNLPSYLLGDLSRATWSNIESQQMDYIQNSITPTCVAIEEELNYKLFLTSEQDAGYYVKFNLDSALRGDSQSRANFYKTMSEIGAYSINEIREKESMDRIDGGDGHRVDLNHVNVDLVDEYQKSKANVGGE